VAASCSAIAAAAPHTGSRRENGVRIDRLCEVPQSSDVRLQRFLFTLPAKARLDLPCSTSANGDPVRVAGSPTHRRGRARQFVNLFSFFNKGQERDWLKASIGSAAENWKNMNATFKFH
jgi:hypothetical protein